MGKRKCANIGWSHLRVESGRLFFEGGVQTSITWAQPFMALPTVTLIHSASADPGWPSAGTSGHVNIYLAEVTRGGFIVSASNPNHDSVHYQCIAVR